MGLFADMIATADDGRPRAYYTKPHRVDGVIQVVSFTTVGLQAVDELATDLLDPGCQAQGRSPGGNATTHQADRRVAKRARGGMTMEAIGNEIDTLPDPEQN